MAGVKEDTVGIIGAGRFGSMAWHYLSREKKTLIFDRDPVRLADCPGATSLGEVCRSEFVLLCVPISQIGPVCEEIAPMLSRGQIVVDTCSVKTRPVQTMGEKLPGAVQILGSHPLFGPDSGKEGISGLRIALCPVRIEEAVLRRVADFLRRLDLLVIETTPEEHDRQMALSQAIFHLIAQAMKRLGWGAKPISTPGPEAFYRLVKTVQRDTDQLFLDMERENPFAAECRALFIEEILRLDRELAAYVQRESGAELE